jgi:predicted AAA+ superfamily ATPase
MAYQDRIIDNELKDRLRTAGAVVLEGPKAVGKTETAIQQAKSIVRLDVDLAVRQAAAVDPGLVLGGAIPRLIDEWQVVPAIWNAVRQEADARKAPGQFILTGSAVPADDETRHTGAGRIVRLRLRPMSLFETGHSSGDVSLEALLNGGPARALNSGMTIQGVAERLCQGGWPPFASLSVSDASTALSDYLVEVARTDIRRVDGVARNPARVERVLRSLARHVATEVALTTIAADVGGPDGPMLPETAGEYLGALERLMLVENQEAWAPQLRSRSRLRTAPKRHFVDPALAAAAHGLLPEALLADLNYMGLLFESLVIRDLRVYAQPRRATVRHYRDNTGLEVDAILELRSGRWAAIEIKLSPSQVDEGAANLHRFLTRVDTSKCGDPLFLGVVTSTGPAYTRDDGVHVLPIGTLGP